MSAHDPDADPGPVPDDTLGRVLATEYPVAKPDPGDDDTRFSFGLTVDVARVLAAHGFPDVTVDVARVLAAHGFPDVTALDASPLDFVDLQLALYRFVYGSEL